MEEEIDLKELFKLFWKYKLIIVLMTAIFAIIGFCYTKYYVVPKYKSTTTLLLAQNSAQDTQDATNEITQTDINLNQKLVSTYSILVKSKSVINQVLENLSMDKGLEEELKNSITVKAVEDTQVIEITYVNENPVIAHKVANELANRSEERRVGKEC